MKRMMITESVRNLLLDSDFLESVLGSPIVELVPHQYASRL